MKRQRDGDGRHPPKDTKKPKPGPSPLREIYGVTPLQDQSKSSQPSLGGSQLVDGAMQSIRNMRLHSVRTQDDLTRALEDIKRPDPRQTRDDMLAATGFVFRTPTPEPRFPSVEKRGADAPEYQIEASIQKMIDKIHELCNSTLKTASTHQMNKNIYGEEVFGHMRTINSLIPLRESRPGPKPRLMPTDGDKSLRALAGLLHFSEEHKVKPVEHVINVLSVPVCEAGGITPDELRKMYPRKKTARAE